MEDFFLPLGRQVTHISQKISSEELIFDSFSLKGEAFGGSLNSI